MMIKYKDIDIDGFKYELTQAKVWHLGSKFLSCNIKQPTYSIIKGQLTTNMGFRWDGASGASDKGFMAGSCMHDALCYAMEDGFLPKDLWKYVANEMRSVNKREGMSTFRRQYTWLGVRLWGRIKPWDN